MTTLLKINRQINSETLEVPELKNYHGQMLEIIFIKKQVRKNKDAFLNSFFSGIGNIILDENEIDNLRNISMI